MRGSWDTLAAILEMAVITYLTRIGGLWLMGRIEERPRVDAAMRYVPGAVLAAIVAPAALTGGLAEGLAVLATIAVMARTKQLPLALVTGVAVAWLLRR
jgi:uncharacterized membrane protein